MTRAQFREARSKNVFGKSFERITKEEQELVDNSYNKLYNLNNKRGKK